ncbi:uncharacterized protein LOC144358263, partial [Saccoglossus kowalevskii]
DVAKSKMPKGESIITFCGLEHLTDMAVKVWMDNWSKADLMQTLVLMGCINITDKAIELIAFRCPNIVTVDVRGCTQLTEKSIAVLTEKCQNLKNLIMTNASVSSVPSSVSQLKKLSLLGCPLHSPKKNLLAKPEVNSISVVKKYLKEKQSYICPSYKMIMLDTEEKKSQILSKMEWKHSRMD